MWTFRVASEQRKKPTFFARVWPFAWCLLAAVFLMRAILGSPVRQTSDSPPDRFKNIEQIEVGDYVRAYNFDSGAVVSRKVLQVYHGITYHFVDIRVAGETITATRAHPFWVESDTKWIEACDLEPGMEVRLVDGRSVKIEHVAIRSLDQPELTFNLEVEGDHNYFVARGKILVHNGAPRGKRYWNYYIREGGPDGRIIYVGRAGPRQSLESVEYRHRTRSAPGYSGPGARAIRQWRCHRSSSWAQVLCRQQANGT